MKKFLNYLFITVLAITFSINGVNAAETELDVTSSEVTSLYDKINVFKPGLGSGDLHGYLYMRDSYSVDDLSNDAKIMIGSHTLTEGGNLVGGVGSPTTFTKEEMAQAMKSVLGNDVTYVDGVLSFGTICVGGPSKYENDIYYFESGCGGVGGPYYETRLLKAIKTDTTIEIYENAIYVGGIVSDGYSDYREVYTPDKSLLITTVDLSEDAELEDYLNKGYVYKYTFTLDSTTNEYYFTRIEKVDYKFENTDKAVTPQEPVVEETVVENPNTGLYIGIGVLSIVLISLYIVSRKKNKFLKI